MIVIFILISVSLVVALSFLAAYFWAVRSGQYEDNYTPSVRILFDDEQTENQAIEEDTEKKSTKKSDKSL